MRYEVVEPVAEKVALTARDLQLGQIGISAFDSPILRTADRGCINLTSGGQCLEHAPLRRILPVGAKLVLVCE